MENIDRFIGIPYVFAGHSFDGADCVGLLRLFYAEHHWSPSMYDGEFTKDWYKVEPFRLIRYLAKHLDSTRDASELSFGDVCYFCINGEGHVGIYLEYGKILSTFPPDCQQWDGSILPDRSMVLHKSMWFKGFSAGFKRKR